MQAPGKIDPATLVEELRKALSNHTPVAEISDNAKPAGVLVPLQYHDDDWHVIVNVRSAHVGQHKGEIAFPGGKLEQCDDDITACALRETWEEMGIRPEDVDVLGPLDAKVTRTNFLVWPTVGVVPYPYPFRPDSREVAEVVELPLTHLLSESAVHHEARLGPDGRLLRRTAYSHGQHLVFGATAWILHDLLDLIRAIGWSSQGWSPEAREQRRSHSDQQT